MEKWSTRLDILSYKVLIFCTNNEMKKCLKYISVCGSCTEKKALFVNKRKKKKKH